MKTTFITTVQHNIGDDFVREGLKFLLKKAFPNENFIFSEIHKHSPITARYGFESIRDNRIGKIIDQIIPLPFTKDRILEADIVIQSGAPVYWCHKQTNTHCSNNEWFKPLIEKRFLKNKSAKLFNLAVGTCQDFHSDATEFLNCSECLSYIRYFHSLADITTVRDSLAHQLLQNLGLSVPLIPCSSLFAVNEYNFKSEQGEYVVLNYMEGGGHYLFNQKINANEWFNTFSKFYHKIKKEEKVVLVCHNLKEYHDAKTIDPQAHIFYRKNDFKKYMKFYSKAKLGIMNRVHGSFLMASLGKPSLTIGNDTRAKMVKEIGLDYQYVSNTSYEYLMDKFNYLKSKRNDYPEKIMTIKNKALSKYMNIFQK